MRRTLTAQHRGQLASQKMGRPSIFRDKRGGLRVQATISRLGEQRFLAARARLAQLATREAGQVSAADTLEFLLRGEAETIRYLNGG